MAKNTQPLPDVTRHETQPFWEGCRRGELMIQRCASCRTWIWYPQDVCHVCNAKDLGWERVSGKGKVFSWVLSRQALHPWFADKLPLIVALVELDDAPGVRFTTNILDCTPEQVKLGMPVSVVFQKINDQITLPYFKRA
ncbi:MAG: hypothetical protein FJ039_07245 [Chloroflexi bacterium]|nr:hypothetical protein [Chloroflexota bacterium]